MKKNSRSSPGDLLIFLLSRSHFPGVNLIPGVSRWPPCIKYVLISFVRQTLSTQHAFYKNSITFSCRHNKIFLIFGQKSS